MIEVIQIGNRTIVIRGVGKLFYQEGFPISMALSELNKKGYEVSFLHIADECMNNGWSSKTTIRKLKAESDIDIDGVMSVIDWNSLEEFCRLGDPDIYNKGGYEKQRELIFQYLFGTSSNEIRQQGFTEEIKDFFK